MMTFEGFVILKFLALVKCYTEKYKLMQDVGIDEFVNARVWLKEEGG
jgi:hypothetical protein